MRSLRPEEYRIRRESYTSQSEAGRYNPASVLLFYEVHGRGITRRQCVHRVVLSKGDSDDCEFFVDGRWLLALSWNSHMDYVGIQAYSLDDCEEYEVFLQGEEHYREVLGRKGLDLNPRTIAARLFECCI